MGLIEEIIEKNRYIWDKSLKTDFFIKLINDEIEEKRMINYLIQDSLYLFEFKKILLKIKSICINDKILSFLDKNIEFLDNDELSLRSKILYSKGINPSNYTLNIELKNYITNLIKITRCNDFNKSIVSILPCIVSYEYLFNIVIKINKHSKYIDLINTYVDKDYSNLIKEFIYNLNLIIKETDDLNDIFKKSSEYEYDFFKSL